MPKQPSEPWQDVKDAMLKMGDLQVDGTFAMLSTSPKGNRESDSAETAPTKGQCMQQLVARPRNEIFFGEKLEPCLRPRRC